MFVSCAFSTIHIHVCSFFHATYMYMYIHLYVYNEVRMYMYMCTSVST